MYNFSVSALSQFLLNINPRDRHLEMIVKVLLVFIFGDMPA